MGLFFELVLVLELQGITLDESGGVNEESRRKLEEVRKRLQSAAMGDRTAESLLASTTSVASDYFTHDEMVQFKKPMKKKKLRKKDKLDLDALEAEAVAEGLGTADLGTRDSAARRIEKQEEMKAAVESRKAAYDNALSKAVDASKVLSGQHIPGASDIDQRTETLQFGVEEDEDLHKSLERARQAALQKQAESVIGPQGVVARIAASKQSADGVLSGTGDSGGRLVFSDTGEFCRSLQLDEALTRRAGPKDVFVEEDEEEAPPVVKEEAEGGWTEIKDTDMVEAQGEMENDTDVLEEQVHEAAVGKGLAGVLSLLQERGTLKETVDWGGRNMDKKKSKLIGIVDESNNVVGQRDILLDRLDEFGRTVPFLTRFSSVHFQSASGCCSLAFYSLLASSPLSCIIPEEQSTSIAIPN
jgi:U4/U6.U5 tri-snRNP-associated protein 1